MDQINDLLPFLEMRVDRKTAIEHMKSTDLSPDLDGDGGLTRSEFVEMCTVVLAKVPLGRLAMAAENYQNGIPWHGSNLAVSHTSICYSHPLSGTHSLPG